MTIKKPEEINSFIHFVFSVIPGAGHMYMGLMSRGSQLMLSFFGLIALTSLLRIEEVTIFLLVTTWFYSFFDSFHSKRSLLNHESVEDKWFLYEAFTDINQYYIGIAVIAVGVLLLFNRMENWVYYYSIIPQYVATWLRIIRTSLVPIGFIILGIYFIKKGKKAVKTE